MIFLKEHIILQYIKRRLRWVFFNADLYLGHKNVLKHCCGPFDTIEHINKRFITNVNNIVRMNDDLYILGDFTAYGIKRGDGIRYREQIICKKVSLEYIRSFFININIDKQKYENV